MTWLFVRKKEKFKKGINYTFLIILTASVCAALCSCIISGLIEKGEGDSITIIDDHEMLRSGTKSWIMGHSDWICQGDSGTHEQAYSDFERMDKEGGLPSILICDLNFYGENTGFEFMEKIHELYPSVANQLNIKKRAVENYISVIYEKTGVNDRAELVLKYGQ